jgi:4'-phosphopantetheinyl transferase
VIDSISVTWLDLDVSSGEIDQLRQLLGPEERRRAARYSSPLLQQRAVVRLARRRQVLAEYCEVAPGGIVIGSHPTGQPFAVSPTGERLALSSSHCGDLGLLAVSRARSVGVDVEAAAELPASTRFTMWVATGLESLAIAELADSDRAAVLLRLWTRKEAYQKATGQGIGAGLEQIEVPLDPEPWARPFRPSGSGARWLLYGLSCPRDGLDAALVSSAPEEGEASPVVNVTHR